MVPSPTIRSSVEAGVNLGLSNLSRPETVVNADGDRGTPCVVARRGEAGQEEWVVGVSHLIGTYDIMASAHICCHTWETHFTRMCGTWKEAAKAALNGRDPTVKAWLGEAITRGIRGESPVSET